MRVALGVSGGIAAYKACEIVRGLTKAGCDVQVLMTRNATEFITPLTLQTLSGNRVLVEPFDLQSDETIQHIDLTRRIDALVVAPATANILAKFARGVADDLLSTFLVSVTAPVVVAPAMNTRMWKHPATIENLERLAARGVQIVDPESGWLAEREVGEGRLAAPELIVERTLQAARRSTQLAGRKIVISAGPTHESIDPVRYVASRSSGKMGFAIADAAARRGARVLLVAGPVHLPTLTQLADAGADAAGPDDAQYLAREEVARHLALGPAAAPEQTVGLEETAGQRQHVCEGELGDGFRARFGDADQREATGPKVPDIDVVEAGSGPHHEPQVRRAFHELGSQGRSAAENHDLPVLNDRRDTLRIGAKRAHDVMPASELFDGLGINWAQHEKVH